MLEVIFTKQWWRK